MGKNVESYFGYVPAGYVGWKLCKDRAQFSNKNEKKTKQKQGGNGVEDTIKMSQNVESVNKKWIQTRNAVV